MPGRILVCVNHRFGTAPSCGARGGSELLTAFQAAALPFGIAVEPIHCFGMCAQGANVRIAPGGPFFHDVTPERIPEIVAQAKAFGGEEVSEARWAPGS